MMRLLTCHPLNLPMSLAEELAPKLRNFWADVAKGDTIFDFSDFPPLARRYFYAFSAIDPLGNPHFIDNQAVIRVCLKRFPLGLGGGCGVWGVGFYRFSGGQLPNFQGKST
jgi:hypothetical protein